MITGTDADSVMSSTPYLPVTAIICILLLSLQHQLVIFFNMAPNQWMIWSCILVTVTVILVLLTTVLKIFHKGKYYRKGLLTIIL